MSATNPVREVDCATLNQWLQDEDVRLVDVREPDEHVAEHIVGAQVVPLSRFDANALADKHNKKVVLYCRTGHRSQQAAQQLMAAGWSEVWQLKGGIASWTAASLPTRHVAGAPISIMRQVQIAAGGIVVVGTLLGALVDPWCLLISGFVGAGLVFAGVSGTCGLATVLGKMPWNRVLSGGAH